MFDRQLGKVIKYNLDSYEGEERLYALTSRMARALIQTTEYLRWNARHMTLPSDLPDVKLLGDWVDNLDERLMLNVNPLENLCAALSDCSDEILQILSDGIDGTNDSDTAKSLRDMLNQYITNVNNNTGSPFNPSPIETDTLRKLFGECVQIVEYTHDIWGDVLEQLEIVTNNGEFIKHAVDSIPFFKFLTDAIPVDGWLDDIDYFIEIVPEEFESGYTVDVPDGSKWKMACKIYCACKDDKKITVDRIYNAFVSMLAGYTIPNFDNLDEWLSSLLGVNDNSELVTYALYSLIWGVARLSSFFGNVRLSDSALKLILKIGEQNTTLDPNDYCSDCDGWTHVFEGGDLSAFSLIYGTNDGSSINSVKVDFTGDNTYRFIIINIAFESRVVTSISVECTFEWGEENASSIPPQRSVFIGNQLTDSVPSRILRTNYPTDISVVTWSGEFTGTGIRITSTAGVHTPSYVSDPGGFIKINKITISGQGSDPF